MTELPQAFRNTDPATSEAAVPSDTRRGGLKIALLRAYLAARMDGRGLSDYEAAIAAGYDPNSGKWKRCSDLRNHKERRDGEEVVVPLIEQIVVDGVGLTRLNPETHKDGMVCQITEAGWFHLVIADRRPQ